MIAKMSISWWSDQEHVTGLHSPVLPRHSMLLVLLVIKEVPMMQHHATWCHHWHALLGSATIKELKISNIDVRIGGRVYKTGKMTHSIRSRACASWPATFHHDRATEWLRWCAFCNIPGDLSWCPFWEPLAYFISTALFFTVLTNYGSHNHCIHRGWRETYRW